MRKLSKISSIVHVNVQRQHYVSKCKSYNTKWSNKNQDDTRQAQKTILENQLNHEEYLELVVFLNKL